MASKDQTRSSGKKHSELTSIYIVLVYAAFGVLILTINLQFLQVWKGKGHLLQNAKNPTSNERRQQEDMLALVNDACNRKKWDRKEGYPIEWVTTDTLDLFESAIEKLLVGNEVKRKTVKKAKEGKPKKNKKNADDVDNVDDHVDNDDDEFYDDDSFDHDDHYDYVGLHLVVQNAMHINDENENENEDNEDEEASLQRMVNEDRESREMMFEVSVSGNHALVRGVKQYDNIFADEEEQNNETKEEMADKLDGAHKELEDCYNKLSTLLKQSKTEYLNSLLVHIKYSQCLTLLENISKLVDENAKEVPAEREQGKYETEVVLGGENEEKGEKEMTGIENAIEVQTVDENAKEVENQREGEGGGENEEEWEKEMVGIENAIEVETVDENAIEVERVYDNAIEVENEGKKRRRRKKGRRRKRRRGRRGGRGWRRKRRRGYESRKRKGYGRRTKHRTLNCYNRPNI
ncbi:DNA ligase 1-like [Helianthus annuus]|uniref:DNA ligase 1-like n=1 Tax=Helianthus annuus TaxID=4232 RepID=UPI000B90405D|nr:DNA ligase 1-like [Helianthus annuus]